MAGWLLLKDYCWKFPPWPVPANSNALVQNFVLGKLGSAAAQTNDSGLSKELLQAIEELSGKFAGIEKENKAVKNLLSDLGGYGSSDTDDDEKHEDGDEAEILACMGEADKAWQNN